MRLFTTILLSCYLLTGINWQSDLDAAKTAAKADHKLILLTFSGSDWCGPCIRLHKEIFDNEVFSTFANQCLVAVNADFPRMKKNQLPKEQQKRNEKMADVYDADGIFPLTLLLDANGKILKRWEGFPNVSAAEFTQQVKAITDANP